MSVHFRTLCWCDGMNSDLTNSILHLKQTCTLFVIAVWHKTISLSKSIEIYFCWYETKFSLAYLEIYLISLTLFNRFYSLSSNHFSLWHFFLITTEVIINSAIKNFSSIYTTLILFIIH